MTHPWKIAVNPSFYNELGRMPTSAARLVWRKVGELRNDPRPDGAHKIKVAKSKDPLYRTRAGNYRILYTFGEGWVWLLALRRRDKAYRDGVAAEWEVGPTSPEPPAPEEDLMEAHDSSPEVDLSRSVSSHSAGSRPLLVSLTFELLLQLGIPLQYHNALLGCLDEESLFREVEKIPHPFGQQVLDAVIPPSIERGPADGELELSETGSLVAFNEGIREFKEFPAAPSPRISLQELEEFRSLPVAEDLLISTETKDLLPASEGKVCVLDWMSDHPEVPPPPPKPAPKPVAVLVGLDADRTPPEQAPTRPGKETPNPWAGSGLTRSWSWQAWIMNRKTALILAGALAVVAIVSLIWWRHSPEPNPASPPRNPTTLEVIGPGEAEKFVDKKCTVEMVVADTHKTRRGTPVIFLNSLRDYKDPANFTVAIFSDIEAELKKAGVDDPATYYKDKKIRVAGTVTKYQGRAEIKLSGADQIQVVK